MSSGIIATQSRHTYVGGTFSSLVRNPYINITGTIIAATSGTLNLQFAQNLSSLTASSVLIGSSLIVNKI